MERPESIVAWIGIDWADEAHAVCEYQVETGRKEKYTLASRSESLQEWRHFLHGISDVIPSFQCGRIGGAVADEHAEVVSPRRRIQHVVIEGSAVRKPFGELIKPGLMTEFIRWVRVRADVIGDGLTVIKLAHTARLTARSLNSNSPQHAAGLLQT